MNKNDSLEQVYRLVEKGAAISTDSRTIKEGDIFIALKGENYDGNDYVLSSIHTGAVLAVSDRADYREHDQVVFVPNTLEFLQDLARHHRQVLNIPILGITGSNGKTTTKELLTHLLSFKFKVGHTKGNFNNHIGLPLTLLQFDTSIEIGIVEMGANSPNDIEELCKIALPTHGIITNVGKAHLEGMGGLEGVIKAKGQLYDFLAKTGGTIFLNVDEPYLEDRIEGECNLVRYSYSKFVHAHNTVRFEYLEKEQGIGIRILSDRKTQNIHTPLVGKYNYRNLVNSIVIATFFGIDISDFEQAFEGFFMDMNRSIKKRLGQWSVILDTYNANPTSMEASIKSFLSGSEKNKVLILGDMFELGDHAKEEHQMIVDLVNTLGGWEQAFFIGDEFVQAKPLPDNHMFESYEQFIGHMKKFSFPEEATILVKGSRGMKLERIMDALSNHP